MSASERPISQMPHQFYIHRAAQRSRGKSYRPSPLHSGVSVRHADKWTVLAYDYKILKGARTAQFKNGRSRIRQRRLIAEITNCTD